MGHNADRNPEDVRVLWFLKQNKTMPTVDSKRPEWQARDRPEPGYSREITLSEGSLERQPFQNQMKEN